MEATPHTGGGMNRVLTIACAVLSVAVLFLVAAVIRLGALGDAAHAEHGQGAGAGAASGIDNGRALDGFVSNATAPQLSIIRLHDGQRRGTASERYARPALSLSKLYIADYVLERGTDEQRWEAINMIADSNDASAGELYAAYPESIDKTAAKYGLLSTRSGKGWGYALTSTYDVATFVAKLKEKDPTSPILVAMAQADAVAADGYQQDWGTAQIPGAIGTKWGWSNDRDLHSSVSFSGDFVVAAAVTGSSEDLTTFVRERLNGMGGWLGDAAIDVGTSEPQSVDREQRSATTEPARDTPTRERGK
ncbi:hypothetical protein [Corynebacterium atypicum]|uniref:hypothetical protein n=1 Tax=Corynebacterium atypicum TaxID=191610 RepID=UPI000A9CBE28|nr:hypothetical protein [Corynebacterium atypicum]